MTMIEVTDIEMQSSVVKGDWLKFKMLRTVY